MNFSLAGSGFQGIYHLGVVKAFQTVLSPQVLARSCAAGSSAGALAAAALVCNVPADLCRDLALILAGIKRKSKLAALDEPLRDFLTRALPNDACERANGRLFVGITSMPTLHHVLVSQFASRDELLDVLLVSCYIPLFTGRKATLYRGSRWYFDGGFSNNTPFVPEAIAADPQAVEDTVNERVARLLHRAPRNVIVSPFAGRFHVAPQDPNALFPNMFFGYDVSLFNLRAAWHALNPPENAMLIKLYQQGQDDANRFIEKTQA